MAKKKKTTKKKATKKKANKKATKKSVLKKKIVKKKAIKKKSSKKASSKKAVSKSKASKKATKKATKKVSKKADKKLNQKTPAKRKKAATKAKKTNQTILPIESEDWPKDREVLCNPGRFKYLNSPRPEACVFCAAANYGVGFESLSLYKGKSAQVILNKYPYHTGHIMVMPVRHVAELSLLEANEYMEIMHILKHSADVIKRAYRCEGLNIGINIGKAAGAGIPGHLHWHVIPRWSGDTNFFPALAKTRLISESLEDTYKKLFPLFQEETKQLSLPGTNEWKQVEFKL